MANVTMVRIMMVAAATLLVELTLNEPTGHISLSPHRNPVR